MTTVKEFKDLGVEFVYGDKGNHYRVGEASSFNSHILWDDSIPDSFAWRPIDMLPVALKYCIEINADKSMWRPLLDQSDAVKPYDFAEHVSGMFKDIKNTEFKIHEDSEITKPKPVFTQAMADKKDPPPIGSSVMVNVHGRGDFKAVVIGSYQRWVWLDVAGIGLDTFDLALAHPIDTRTPKQKAVDEMYYSWMDFKNNKGDQVDSLQYELCEYLYENDFIKC